MSVLDPSVTHAHFFGRSGRARGFVPWQGLVDSNVLGDQYVSYVCVDSVSSLWIWFLFLGFWFFASWLFCFGVCLFYFVLSWLGLIVCVCVRADPAARGQGRQQRHDSPACDGGLWGSSWRFVPHQLRRGGGGKFLGFTGSQLWNVWFQVHFLKVNQYGGRGIQN